MAKSENIYPDKETWDNHLKKVVPIVANILYWQKLREDSFVYFDNSMGDESTEGREAVRSFLIKTYSAITPDQFKGQKVRHLTERKDVSMYADTCSNLKHVDEYITFKKYFAEALGNDKSKVQAFLDSDGPMR